MEQIINIMGKIANLCVKPFLLGFGVSNMPRARSENKEKHVKGKQDNKNKKTTLVPITFLPHEIIFEILSRLEVQSLLRCKCVCKQWYDIIQDPKFIEKQRTRTTITCFYPDRIEETFLRLDSCHGLLLEQSNSTYKYHIRNPATRQILDLPEPLHKDVVSMVISFVKSTGNYKLVSIYDEEKGVTGNGGCEVLTLGSDDLSWRPLNITNLHNLNRYREKIEVLPLCGVVYCFRFVRVGLDVDSEVVCLNLENEDFTSMKVPQDFFTNWKKVWPLIWKGKMSLVGIEGGELVVWVLEDYKNHKWAERKIVIPLTFLKEYPSMEESLVPCAAKGDKVCFYVNDNILAYYTDTKQVRFTETAPKGKIIVCLYKPSLVTLKGMRPQMKQITNELAKSDKVGLVLFAHSLFFLFFSFIIYCISIW